MATKKKTKATKKRRRKKPEKIIETINSVIQGKWNAKQLKAIIYFANPQGGTQVKLSKEIKVSEKTISEWKRLEGWWEDVHRVAAVYFLEADLQVDRACLRDALKDPADNPAIANAIIKARELYYRRRGLLIEGKPSGREDDPIHYRVSYPDANDNR